MIRRLDPTNHRPEVRAIVARLAAQSHETLGDLTQLCYRYPMFYGFEYQSSGVLVLKGENINREGELLEVESPSFISKEVHARFSLTHLKENDLIISVRGEVGKVGLIPSRMAGANINANTIRIELKPRAKGEDYMPGFIWLYLNSGLGKMLIQQSIAGGVQETITASELLAVMIPKLPYRKQFELVSSMDSARETKRANLTEANALLARMDEFLLTNLTLNAPLRDERKVFASSVGSARTQLHLNAEYFHPERVLALRALNTPSRGVPSEKLSEVVSFVRDQIKTPGLNYLSLAHVQSNTGELTDSKDEAAGACSEYQVDDVLFARLRPYLNKVYRAEMNGCCSPEFHVLRVKDTKKLLPDYLAAVLRSSLTLAQTRHMMTGNTHPRLTNEDVTNLVVPIPKNIATQQKVADEVKRRREEARRLRAEAEAGWQEAKLWFENQLLGGGK